MPEQGNTSGCKPTGLSRQTHRAIVRGASHMSAMIAVALAISTQAADLDARPPVRITRVVAFGDSLSDAGTYGWRFTTMPGLTFAQRLAIDLQQSPEPNERLSHYASAYRGQAADGHPGGLNYAEGGARANHAYSVTSVVPEGVPIRSLSSSTISWPSTKASHPATW